MDRSLDSLSPEFKPVAFELLARLTEAGLCVMIINTRRTQSEQDANVTNGVSWVKRFDTYLLAGPDKLKWDDGDPVWDRIGKVGESLGLRWGGRWQQRDMGHFELVRKV